MNRAEEPRAQTAGPWLVGVRDASPDSHWSHQALPGSLRFSFSLLASLPPQILKMSFVGEQWINLASKPGILCQGIFSLVSLFSLFWSASSLPLPPGSHRASFPFSWVYPLYYLLFFLFLLLFIFLNAFWVNLFPVIGFSVRSGNSYSQKGGHEVDRGPGGWSSQPWDRTVGPAPPWNAWGSQISLSSPEVLQHPTRKEYTSAIAVTGSLLSSWTSYMSHDGELCSSKCDSVLYPLCHLCQRQKRQKLLLAGSPFFQGHANM